MEAETYRVKLDELFEGPMDLLVHLVKKNEVDIYDIPIALVTQQYLEYLEWMQSLNIDLAGDFLVMASTLAQIKSKMLLPQHNEDEDAEDPRMEIVRPLEEYLRIKSAAEELARRDLLGETTFVRKPTGMRQVFEPEEEVIQVGLFELIDAFQKILKNISPDDRLDMTVDQISVKDRISQLVDLFETNQSLTFNELFAENATVGEVIVTFLALLEMVRLNLIRMIQNTQSGVIRLLYQ
jgi:segregation and condensation protein A